MSVHSKCLSCCCINVFFYIKFVIHEIYVRIYLLRLFIASHILKSSWMGPIHKSQNPNPLRCGRLNKYFILFIEPMIQVMPCELRRCVMLINNGPVGNDIYLYNIIAVGVVVNGLAKLDERIWFLSKRYLLVINTIICSVWV